MSEELPKLFSDEEFEALHQQRENAVRSAHDLRGESRIRPEHKPTDGLPESTMEQMFPHIAQKLTVVWSSEACALYINNLVIVDRGSRQGFRVEVLEDLMMLHEINEMLTKTPASRPAAAAPAAWPEAVPREHD